MEEFLKGKNKGDYEILKIKYTLAPSSKKRKSIMFYPRIIWRSGLTDIEQILLDGLKKLGYKEDEDFVVQYPVEGRKYVLDFAFLKEKIDIEADGEYWHEKCKLPGEDEERDNFLKSKGWTVLRFKGKAIKNDLSGVLKNIKSTVSRLRYTLSEKNDIQNERVK